MTRDELRDKIMRLLWGADQDSIETPFEKLSGPVLNDLEDLAEQILSIPKIAEGIGMVVVKDISDVIPLS